MNDPAQVPPKVEQTILRWAMSVLTALSFGMAGIIWANLTSQITTLQSKIEVQAQTIYTLQIDIHDLKTRISDLVIMLDKSHQTDNSHAK